MKNIIIFIMFIVLATSSYAIDYCYQETANVSTTCGGLDSGFYYGQFKPPAADGLQNYSFAYDGDYTTWSNSTLAAKHLYVTYRKPESIVKAIWQVKDTGGLVNLSIPQGCLERNSSYLLFTVTSNQGAVGDVFWRCKNLTSGSGEDGQLLRRTQLGYNIYEEALFWKINTTLNLTIRDEETEELIKSPINVRLALATNDQIPLTVNNGNILIGLQNASLYTITFSANNYSTRKYVLDIPQYTTITNLTAYLTTNNTMTTFTTKDKDTSELLENVLVGMFKFINGQWTAVESKYTDITGRIQFAYVPGTKYRFYLSKSSYNEYVFNLDPILYDEYDVLMTKNIVLNVTQNYDQVAILYSPQLFYNGVNNFSFIIQSPDNALLNYGYSLTYPGGSSINDSNNPIGSQLDSFNFQISNPTIFDRVKLHYHYETSLGGLRNFTFYYPIYLPTVNNTMAANKDNTYGMGLFERTLISTIVVIFVIGIATLVGQPVAGFALALSVLGYLTYIGIMHIWATAITILLGLLLVGMRGD